jgi:hypothetical protein
MIYIHIRLFKEGIPIPAEKLSGEKRNTENLVIEERLQSSSFSRPVRRARLLSTMHGADNDSLPPLFAPVLVKPCC